MSLTCKDWHKLIRTESMLLLYVNLHFNRLLGIWPPALRSLLIRDESFMAGGATLSVLCGLSWFPGDLDLYCTSFKQWGFSLSHCEDNLPYHLAKESLPDNGQYISSADFYSLYSESMGFQLIKTYVPGFGKVDFIETQKEAKDVIAQFDFPFTRNAFLFKGGKVVRVVLGDLKSLLSRSGDSGCDMILAYLQEQLDGASLNAWRESEGYKRWKKHDFVSLRKWFQEDGSYESLPIPQPLYHCLRTLISRILKYEKRGFYITDSSLGAFRSDVDKILLGGADTTFRAKKRIKLN